MLTEWAKGFAGEASKEDIEEDTSAIRIRCGRNVAMDAAGAGQGGIVGHTLRVVLGYGSISQFARSSWNRKSIISGCTVEAGCPWNLSADKSKTRESSEGNGGVHFQPKNPNMLAVSGCQKTRRAEEGRRV